MAAAKRKYEGENKRQKFEYMCNECKLHYQQKEVQVDHIIPLGALKRYEDLPGFVERLFVGVEGLQVLCSTCHQTKTNKEREDRKQHDHV